MTGQRFALPVYEMPPHLPFLREAVRLIHCRIFFNRIGHKRTLDTEFPDGIPISINQGAGSE
jgi:hypothetical protein